MIRKERKKGGTRSSRGDSASDACRRGLLDPFLAVILLACAGGTAGAGEAVRNAAGWEARRPVEMSLGEVIALGLDQSPVVEIERLRGASAQGRLLAAYDILVPQLEVVARYAERERLVNEFETEAGRRLRARDSQLTAADQSGIDLGIDAPDGGFDDAGDFEALNLPDDPDGLDFSDPGDFEPLEYYQEIRNSRVGISQLLPTGAEVELSLIELDFEDTYTAERSPNGIPLSPLFPGQQEYSLALSVSQPLLRGFGSAVTLAPIRIRRAEYDLADAEFLASLDAYIGRIAQLYSRLAVLDMAVDAHRLSVVAARELLDQTRRLHGEGRTDIVELSRQRAALAEREVAHLRAQTNFLNGQNELLGLVLAEYDSALSGARLVSTTPMETRFESAGGAQAHVHDAMAAGPAGVPRLAAGLAGVREARIRRTLLEDEARPRLDLTASYGYRGVGVDSGDAWADVRSTEHTEWLLGFNFSMPLWNTLARGRASEARAQLNRARQQYQKTVLDVSLAIEKAFHECQLADTQRELAAEQTAAAAEAVQAERLKLDEGRSLASLVQELQRDLLFARLRELEALYNLQAALIDLRVAKGTIASHYGVEVAAADALTEYRPRPRHTDRLPGVPARGGPSQPESDGRDTLPESREIHGAPHR